MAVYQYEAYDSARNLFLPQSCFGTIAAIESVQGLVMLETRREVAATHVGADGWYIGPPLGL